MGERDLVAAVRETVSELAPIDRREARSRARVLDALNHLQHPFSREADPTHLTGSAIVVGPRGVLLHRHRRLGIWIQPGGHIDPGETPWDAARRETVEETGIEVDFVRPPAPPPLMHVDAHPAKEHFHLDLRYLVTPVGEDDTPRPPPNESQEVSWFGWADARRIADPGLTGILANLDPTTPDSTKPALSFGARTAGR